MVYKTKTSVYTVKSRTRSFIPLLNAILLKTSIQKLSIGSIYTKFSCTFSLKSHEILFGIVINISENSVVKFNYCLLNAKYYLYCQKVYSKRCNMKSLL